MAFDRALEQEEVESEAEEDAEKDEERESDSDAEEEVSQCRVILIYLICGINLKCKGVVCYSKLTTQLLIEAHPSPMRLVIFMSLSHCLKR